MYSKEFEVIGFKNVQYKKKDGTEVNAYEVYLKKCLPDDSVQGDQVEVCFLNTKYSQYLPCIGDKVVQMFNRFGRIDDLYLV